MKPGENTIVNFNLSPEDLSFVTEDGSLKQYTGKVQIAIGGSQPDEKNGVKNSITTQIEIED